MNKPYLAPTVLLLSSLLAGCADSVPPYREGRAEWYAPPQVQIAGPDAYDLQRWTAIDVPITYRDPANLLFVTIPLRNTSDRVLIVQYRYNFVDAKSLPIGE